MCLCFSCQLTCSPALWIKKGCLQALVRGAAESLDGAIYDATSSCCWNSVALWLSQRNGGCNQPLLQCRGRSLGWSRLILPSDDQFGTETAVVQATECLGWKASTEWAGWSAGTSNLYLYHVLFDCYNQNMLNYIKMALLGDTHLASDMEVVKFNLYLLSLCISHFTAHLHWQGGF